MVQLANSLPASKRNLLRVVSTVFDPLGMVSPLVIPMKVLFQELCQNKVGWDELLSEPFER